jgi:hypothetical protein
MPNNARISAHVTRQANKLASKLDKRYERSPVVFQGVSAGHNQVQIGGKLYPAEGVDGQGGSLQVINVGTPAVARYAPPNRSSVIALSGSGGGSGGGGSGGGGGGGATNLDALTDVTITGPANGQVLQYNGASGQWLNMPFSFAPSPHGLSSAHHNGLLNWPLINFSGSTLHDLATRLHSDLQGIGPDDHHPKQHVLATGTGIGPDHTISGAAAGQVLRALSATTAQFMKLHHTDLDTVLPDQHHPQQHVLATDVALGADHTISGALPGYVLRASSPTAAQFMQLNHDDLNNVLPDQHHTRVHNIITGDATGAVHSITGVRFQLVGATGTNVLGLLTPSAAPGAAEAILKTDINGGIQLDTNLLYVDGANNWVGINRVPSGATFDLIAFSNADHTQRIKQKSGQTGRMWRIEDLSGSELIVLDSVGNLQSGHPGFVSGLTGWQITPVGNAEFNNIWARGELHATVFVKDEIHASGGSFFVATAGTLHDDAVISSSAVDDDVLVVYSTPAGMGVPLQVVTTSGTFTGNELHVAWIGNFITINDPPSGPGFYFQPGDVIRSKTEVPTGVTDFWFEVISATQNSGYATYSVYKRSGTDGTLPKGSAVVSYGKQGDGRILMTSDLNYAPYIDVFTVGPNVWTGAAGSVVPRMRMGRLDGIGLPGISGVEQYGMIAGKDLSDANTGYLIASNLQLALYKTDIRLNNGIADTGLWTADGNIRIGKNVGADATTGFRVYTTDAPGANAGDVIIGNVATGNYLQWSQAAGVLFVQGQLLVAGGGGTVDQAYVDAKDVQYDGYAQTYGTTAQNNAQVYGTARRLVGVTGTWTSPGPNQISWTALSAAFANGTSRSISSTGSPLTIGARTYLYVSVAGTGTITMLTTTNPALINSPDHVLIAVADPGSPKASVTVVAGTTYISGSNIATSSITTNQIAANAIYANQIVAGEVHASHLAADVLTTTTDAATAKASGQRTIAVTGTFVSTGYQSISWGTPTNVQVVKGDSTLITITDGVLNAASGAPLAPLTTRLYLYILETDAGTVGMRAVSNIDSLPANAIMIAVVTPGTTGVNGTENASIVMVNGGVLISGDSIAAGSIIASNIKANSITSAQIAADVYTTANSKKVLAVNGTFTPSLTNAALVSWTGVTLVRGDGGALQTITNGNTGTMTARTYLYINDGDPTSTTMKAQTDINLIPPNAIMVAVCEPGVEAASAVVVGGGVVISGDDIVAGSINADRIVADTITAVQLAPSYETALTTQINAAASSAGGTAQTAATDYSNARHLIGVSGTWTVTGRNAFNWSNFSVRLGDGTRNVGLGSFSSTTFVRRYFWIDVTATTPALTSATDPTTLGPNAVLIAVFDPGAVASPTGGGMGTLTILGGTTWIGGDQIITDSIVGNRIKANSINAGHIIAQQISSDKMNINDLSAMKGTFSSLNTGPLTVNGSLAMNTTGKIYSGTKTAYGTNASEPGFFLGYDTAFPLAAYKFKVGDIAKSEFSWDGATMAITGSQALQIANTASGQIFSIRGPGSSSGLLTLNSVGALAFTSSGGTNANFTAPLVTANKFIQTGDTLQLVTPRVVASAQSMPGSLGFKGEMCWGIDGIGRVWLYLCYADNNWYRIQFPTTTW